MGGNKQILLLIIVFIVGLYGTVMGRNHIPKRNSMTIPEYQFTNDSLLKYATRFIEHEKSCSYYSKNIPFVIWTPFVQYNSLPIIQIETYPFLKKSSDIQGAIMIDDHFIFINTPDLNGSILNQFVCKKQNQVTFDNFYIPKRDEIMAQDDSFTRLIYLWDGKDFMFDKFGSYFSKFCAPCNHDVKNE